MDFTLTTLRCFILSTATELPGEAQVFNKPTVSYVVEKADVTEPNSPADSEEEQMPDDSSDVTSDTPKTEDSSTMTAALIIMAVSAGIFAALLRKRKTSV